MLDDISARKQRKIIQRAMNRIEEISCVTFRERVEETDFIEIHSGKDCSSDVGMQDGRQLLSLNTDGCVTIGIVLHELVCTLLSYSNRLIIPISTDARPWI